eukprot:SAG11_NODE_22470_length_405_cov_1.689542_1_plen_42_part_00
MAEPECGENAPLQLQAMRDVDVRGERADRTQPGRTGVRPDY